MAFFQTTSLDSPPPVPLLLPEVRQWLDLPESARCALVPRTTPSPPPPDARIHHPCWPLVTLEGHPCKPERLGPGTAVETTSAPVCQHGTERMHVLDRHQDRDRLRRYAPAVERSRHEEDRDRLGSIRPHRDNIR